MFALTVHSLVKADGLFNWASSQGHQALSAIQILANVVMVVIAIVLLVAYHRSMGKLIAGGLTLIIAAALINGGIISALSQKVTDQVNSEQGATISITQQL